MLELVFELTALEEQDHMREVLKVLMMFRLKVRKLNFQIKEF